MKIALLVAGALLVATPAMSFTALTPDVLRKDRAVMMIYEGRDKVTALIPQADSANLALILLHQMRGPAVQPSELEGRACLGIALFSKPEWDAVMASGRKPEEVRPSEATLRMRVYAGVGAIPPAVHHIQSGTTQVAAGLQEIDKQGNWSWSLKARIDSATGPCTVE